MSPARTYLDWNATAPLRPEARAAMIETFDLCGNPSSVHAEGRRARRIVEDARDAVAALIGANSGDIVFTSGASEANAAVLRSGWNWIASPLIEHDSVIASIKASGGSHVVMAAARSGVAVLEALRQLPKAGRGLVSLHLANNETGVMQPVDEAAALAKAAGAHVHTDATQAAGRVAVDMAALGADYLSISAHKLGGPKGIGALAVRDGAPLDPLITGGRQERNRRAGTENVAAIAGFAAAAKAALSELQAAAARMSKLRDQLESELLASTPGALIIGRDTARLPNTTLAALPGRSAETLVAGLDLEGVAVSSGSACSSGKVTQSRVLDAMGYAPDVAKSAVRVSLGPTSTVQDIAAFAAAWTRMTRVAARAA